MIECSSPSKEYERKHARAPVTLSLLCGFENEGNCLELSLQSESCVSGATRMHEYSQESCIQRAQKLGKGDLESQHAGILLENGVISICYHQAFFSREYSCSDTMDPVHTPVVSDGA